MFGEREDRLELVLAVGRRDAIRLTLGRIEGAPSTVAIGIVYSDAILAKGPPKAEGL